MKRNIAITICLLISFFALTVIDSAGEEDMHADMKHDGELHLSEDIRKMLSQEMNLIQSGMQEIVASIAAGDWGNTASVAIKIKESYIMKQRLTKDQIEELHHSLPTGFKELDQRFHAMAGKLAEAAKKHDPEIVNFLFYKLNESCIECHAKYAKKRFPAFEDRKAGHEHH